MHRYISIKRKQLAILMIIVAVTTFSTLVVWLAVKTFADEAQWIKDFTNTYGIPDFSFKVMNSGSDIISPSNEDSFSFNHDEDDVYNVNIVANADYDFDSITQTTGYRFLYEVDGVVKSRKENQELKTNQYSFYLGSLDVYKLISDYENNNSNGQVKFKAYLVNGEKKAEIYSHDINFSVDTIYPHLTLESISQYDKQISPIWDEFLFKGAEGSGDFGDYYYPVANNTDKVTVGVRVDGIPEGETWKIFYDQEITAADNGKIFYKEIQPSASMEDSCKFRGDGSASCYNYANEYIASAYLQKNSESWGEHSVRAVLRPEKVGSSDIEILSVQQNGVDVYLDTIGRREKICSFCKQLTNINYLTIVARSR